MEHFANQFVPGLLGTSFSVGIVLLLMRSCAGWLDQNLRLTWKKWLYLFLAIRLLIPVNIGIPVIHRAQVGDTVQSEITQTDAVTKNDMTDTDASGIQTQAQPWVELYHPIRFQVSEQRVSWLLVCFYIWLTGFGIYIAYFVGEFLYCRWKLLRRARPVDEVHMRQMVQQIARELGLRRSIRVMSTPEQISPMLIGFVRPVLLLPEISYENDAYYYILKHELVHLKNNDIFYKYVFLLANALHWFDPLVYLLAKSANVNLELCCDACVVADADGDGKKQYVQAIMSAVDVQAVHARFSTEFYGGKETMKLRFANILKQDERKYGAGVVALFVAVTLAGGMLTACTAQKVKSDAESQQPAADGMESSQMRETESMEPSQMEEKDTESMELSQMEDTESTEPSQMEEKNTEAADVQIAGQEDGTPRFAGLWAIDAARTDASLKESESVYDMFGSGLHLGDELEIRSDGTVRYYIGIGIGGEGAYQIDGDTLTAQMTPYEPHGFEGEDGLVARYVIEDGTDFLYCRCSDFISDSIFCMYLCRTCAK